VQATGGIFAVFLDGALEDFLSAAGNVHFGAIGNKSLEVVSIPSLATMTFAALIESNLGDHEPDAGAASCDYCCDVRDIE
jgi:hypothetical protein